MKVEIDGKEYVEKKEEVTYSMGDKFTRSASKFLLAAVRPCSEGAYVALIHLPTGRFWDVETHVVNPKRITKDEFKLIAGGFTDFERTWNFKNQGVFNG